MPPAQHDTIDERDPGSGHLLAMRVLLRIARRELAATGEVSADTWAAIDELHGRYVALQPPTDPWAEVRA